MSEKSRKIAFTIIAIVLSLITLWIAAGYCSLISSPLLSSDNVENINIDGSDWTPLFKIGAWLVNGVITAAFVVIFIVAELVVMPATWGIFRAAAFRKNPTVCADELAYSWRVFVITSLGTVAFALVFMVVYAVRAKSGAPFSALLFCWLNPLMMWAIYITKLKKQLTVDSV